MNTKSYRNIFIISLIFAAVLIGTTFYVVGIIDKHSAEQMIDTRLKMISKAADDYEAEIDSMLTYMGEDGVSKAKSLSIMLNNDRQMIRNIETIEEIRIAFAADEVIITNDEGTIVSSTQAFVGKVNIADDGYLSQFMSGIGDRTYEKYALENDGKKNYIYAAASRRDLEEGLIIIKTPTDHLDMMYQLAGIANVTTQFPFMRTGTTSIIDITSWKYLSNTNLENVDEFVQIDKSMFDLSEEMSPKTLIVTLQGKKSLVRYEVIGDKLITANVKTSEVYARRNYSVGALIIILPIVVIFVLLAVRQRLIKQK